MPGAASMPGAAFCPCVFQGAFLPAPSIGRRTPLLRPERHAFRPRFTATLQEVDPMKLTPPSTPLPPGTLFHIIRGHPPHLPPPSHALDGDGYLLAVTLSEDASFLRGRYIRTRAYLRESRAGERLYPSRAGTPSSRRFRRLRKACADGVFVVRERVFTWGEGGLPMGVNASTLVSRGYSSLGGAISDRDELARERGQSVAARPVQLDDGSLAVCAVSSAGFLFAVRIDGELDIVERPEPATVGKGALVLDFAVTDKFFVALCARTVAPSAGRSMRMLLGGSSEAPDVDAGAGAFLALVPRGTEGQAAVVELPEGAFCTRIDDARSDGEKVSLRLCEVSADGALTRAQLADLPATAEEKVAHFLVNVTAEEATRVDSEARSVSVSDRSPCGRYASVFERSKERVGIARVAAGELGDVVWMAAGTSGVSGVAASPDGATVSALVHGETGAALHFWNTDDLAGGPVASIGLPREQFGTVPPSAGGCWAGLTPKWPEGGKVVKSAYEIFDDRKWNDINSGFSSFGLNQ